MIVVDTSSIFAILFKEPDGPACGAALGSSEQLVISAGTLAEAYVVAARSGFIDALERFLAHLQFEVAPVDVDVAKSVGDAYARFGRGLHSAKLNYGDCFAYVLAKQRNCPLLFIGNDFALTDIASALPIAPAPAPR